MKYLIHFYLVVIVVVSAVLFSCTKNETANTQQDILLRHTWKHYQTRTVTYDTTTNTVVQDTMVLTEACYQNSLFVFATDSVVKRTLQCFTPANTYEGRWYLKADSTFSAPIMVRTSYGTGVIYINQGIPYGKMKLLTETDLQVFTTEGINYGNRRAYSTLYYKAAN
jgi:hypothetical protein